MRTKQLAVDNGISVPPLYGISAIGVPIPGCSHLLELAARCYEMTGLGYQGVDIALGKDKDPLIHELNARPGLNIQIANKTGLLSRLDLVERDRESLTTLSDRIAFARENF